MKAAYVVAFANFGYWHITRSEFDRARSEIAEPGRGHLEPLPILTDFGQEERTHRTIGVDAPLKALGYQIGHDIVLVPHAEPDPEFWNTMDSVASEVEGRLTCGQLGGWPRYPEYRLDPPHRREAP